MAELNLPEITHHGAVDGVTGSCHRLSPDEHNSILIDCGLFQGTELSADGAGEQQLNIGFETASIRALVVTHCHIDHVGRIPYLLAAGFQGPIYCTQASAHLLPLVLRDAVAIGFSKDPQLLKRFDKLLQEKIHPVPYGAWQNIALHSSKTALKIKFKPAGHILGSAYIECDVSYSEQSRRIVFSGDLGGPYTPLLPNPQPPYKADVLVLESTYGDHLHEGRKERKNQLKSRIEQCLQNKGVIIIPAFSIGRTQELLYELEEIIHQHKSETIRQGLTWENLEIIVDSPLANQFTEVYKKLRPFWDAEAQVKLKQGRHPLSFEQLTTINSHQEHLATVEYLQKNARPCVVLAASGMCNGGRVVNYLKALLSDKRTDILFVGYQAQGTIGRAIQQYGPKHGYVEIESKRYDIAAEVYTLHGYSAHADQQSLVRFVKRMRIKPAQIRLVHGDDRAKQSLRQALQVRVPDCEIIIP